MKQEKQTGLRNKPKHEHVPSHLAPAVEETTGPPGQAEEDRWSLPLLERAAVPSPEARAIRDWGINE